MSSGDKLVRDYLKYNPRAGQVFRLAAEHEKLPLLKKKLQEEVDEFINTPNLEEAADIIQVLLSFMNYIENQHSDITLKQIEFTRKIKLTAKGSFSEFLVLCDPNKPKLATDLPPPPQITEEDKEQMISESKEWYKEFSKKQREMENITSADWSTKVK